MRKIIFCLILFLLCTFLTKADIFARKGGDANNDGKVNVADVVFLVHHFYRGGPAPKPLTYGDCDGDFDLDQADIVCAISYLYGKGEHPATPLEILEISVTTPHNADGLDSSTVTITVTDSLENPVTGAPLEVLLYIGEDPGEDPPPSFPVTDNGDGTYVSRVASTTAGDGVIAVELVSLNLVSLSPITVTFEPGEVKALTIVDVEQPREEEPRQTGKIVAVAVDSFQNPVHPPEANIIFETDFGEVDSTTFDESGDFIGWISSQIPGWATVFASEEYTGYNEAVDLVFPAVHLFPPVRSDTTWTDSTWLKRDTTGYLDIGLNVWNPGEFPLGYYDFLIHFDSSVVRFLEAQDWDLTDELGAPDVDVLDSSNVRISQVGTGGNSNDIARLHFQPVSLGETTSVTVDLWNGDPTSLSDVSGFPVYSLEDWYSFLELELYEVAETQKPPKWISIKLWVAPGADARGLADQIAKAYALFRSHAAKCCPMMYEHILFNYIPDSTWDSLTGDNDSLDTRAERDSARARFDSSGYVDVIGAPDDALPGWSGVAVAGDAVIVDGDATATGTTMAHELGHYWGLQGHNDPAGNPWGKDNLMHATSNPSKGTKKCVGLTAEQCSTITANADP